MSENTRNLIFGAIIAIASGFVGFVLQRAITQDSLSIESVYVTPDIVNYVPTTDAWASVNRGLVLCGPRSGSANFGMGINPPESISPKGMVLYLRWLETQLSYYKSSRLDIEIFKKKLEGAGQDQSDKYIQEANLLGVCYGFARPEAWKAAVIAGVGLYLENLNKLVLELESEVKLAKEFKFLRSGRVSVTVAVVNKGDTDGLVERSATLVWRSGQEIPLFYVGAGDEGSSQGNIGFPWNPFSVKSDSVAASATIPRRSAVQLVFSIDEASASSAKLTEFLKSVEYKNEIDYKIILSDFRGSKLQSIEYRLSVQ